MPLFSRVEPFFIGLKALLLLIKRNTSLHHLLFIFNGKKKTNPCCNLFLFFKNIGFLEKRNSRDANQHSSNFLVLMEIQLSGLYELKIVILRWELFKVLNILSGKPNHWRWEKMEIFVLQENFFQTSKYSISSFFFQHTKSSPTRITYKHLPINFLISWRKEKTEE